MDTYVRVARMQADPFYEEVAAEAMAREAIRNVAAAEAGEMCGICSPEGAAAGARELELASVARVMAANEAAARAAEEAAGAEWQEDRVEREVQDDAEGGDDGDAAPPAAETGAEVEEGAEELSSSSPSDGEFDDVPTLTYERELLQARGLERHRDVRPGEHREARHRLEQVRRAFSARRMRRCVLCLTFAPRPLNGCFQRLAVGKRRLESVSPTARRLETPRSN